VSAPAEARTRQARLGEWACLGVLYPGPAHGWAVSRELLPDGAVGRVWSLSRPLTYRALEALGERGWVAAVGSEAGAAGPNRTILAVTRIGRIAFRRWVDAPVEHIRDLRSELLLKLVLAERAGLSTADLLVAQRTVIDRLPDGRPARRGDVVALWRHEAKQAALRFLDQLDAG
jgi:DNA-binding PadR family transcriptional regulator